MKTAVFLDRDGTINKEVAYLSRVEDLILLPTVAEAIRQLNDRAIRALVVTNQSGIGRGLYRETDMLRIHAEIERRLAAEGSHLDGIYFCPHHPDEECDCRKPQSGMLVRAAREHGLDLTTSFVVGDKITDLQAGQRVGCQTVLVLTGYGEEEKDTTFPIDFIAADLLEAVTWIIRQLD
jgi:D-glycero-D-manno-heptose 1,7-bisphosphate phosphatase